MSALRIPRLTIDEYITIENAALYKSEFFDGEMFAMAGASPPHNIVRENLSAELHARLKGSGCRSVSSDQRLKVVRTGLFTYPDLLVICGPWQFDAKDPNAVINPVLIVEVLSPSTEKYDRGAKFRNYRQIPTLREYILIAQDEPICERYVRQPDDSWALTWFVGLDQSLAFAIVDASIPLTDLYAGVALTDSGDPAASPAAAAV